MRYTINSTNMPKTCQIRYKVKAYVANNNGKDKPIYGKRVFIIRPNPSPLSNPVEISSTE